MKKLLFKALLLSLILTSQSLVNAQTGPGTTGSKRTNSDGSLQTSGPGAQLGTATPSIAGGAAGSNMSTQDRQSNTATSRNPTVTGPGTSIGPGKTTGTNGLSSPDGQGGAGAKSSVTENNGVGAPRSTGSEAQQGAAPAGATSDPKSNSIDNGEGSSRGSSSNGGTTSITGSRQDTPETVPGNTSASWLFGLPMLAVLVGMFLIGAFWMKRKQ